jgi:uncharacterized protein YbjT (DUF2867 family)
MILITGATGKTGQAVLRALQAAGQPAHAFARRQAEHAGETVLGDLADPAAAARALVGVDALYFIVPNVHPDEEQIGATWIAAAKAAGLRRFVYHSVLYPQIEAMPHHWHKLRVEEQLIQSGLDFTILQPASYMQNLLPYIPAMRERGEYVLPYSPESRFSPLDLGDLGAAAARLLAESGHTGASYQLAGPDVLSSAQMAQRIAERLGRPVAAHRQPLGEWQRANAGLPPYALDALSRMFVCYDAHDFAASSHQLVALLGRKPATFAEFVEREIK